MRSIQDEVMSCATFVELVTEYLEESLPAGPKARLEQHLFFCEGCVTYLDQIRTTSRLIKKIAMAAGDTESDSGTVENLTHVFRRWRASQRSP
jgi:hypothetical protein